MMNEILKKLLEDQNMGREVKNFFHIGLDPQIAIFRYNVLHCVEFMIHICEPLLSYQKKYICEDEEIPLSVKDAEMLMKLLIFQSYLKIYYNCFLCSENFVKNAYEYVYGNPEIHERQQHKLESKICKVCDERESEENHHLIPITYGGDDKPYNIISVCHRCHKMDCFEVIFDFLKKHKEELKDLNYWEKISKETLNRVEFDLKKV